jgi:hypothetical protein
VLATNELFREWGYVAMSRARLETRLYLATEPARDGDLDHTAQPTAAPILQVIHTLERSHAKHLALDQQVTRGRNQPDPVAPPAWTPTVPAVTPAGPGLQSPRHVIAELGGCHPTPGGRALWQAAATQIQRYRQRHGIEDPKRALGPILNVTPQTVSAWRCQLAVAVLLRRLHDSIAQRHRFTAPLPVAIFEGGPARHRHRPKAAVGLVHAL